MQQVTRKSFRETPVREQAKEANVMQPVSVAGSGLLRKETLRFRYPLRAPDRCGRCYASLLKLLAGASLAIVTNGPVRATTLNTVSLTHFAFHTALRHLPARIVIGGISQCCFVGGCL